jgi:hypothetical protein
MLQNPFVAAAVDRKPIRDLPTDLPTTEKTLTAAGGPNFFSKNYSPERRSIVADLRLAPEKPQLFGFSNDVTFF